MSERLDGLKQRLGQLSDINHALSLAHWDQQTMMPPGGAPARAETVATVQKISHGRPCLSPSASAQADRIAVVSRNAQDVPAFRSIIGTSAGQAT